MLFLGEEETQEEENRIHILVKLKQSFPTVVSSSPNIG